MSVNSLLRSDLPLIPVLCGLSQAGGSVLYMSYWAISTIFTVCPVQATPTSGCSQFVAVENDKIPEMPVFPGISGTWKVLNIIPIRQIQVYGSVFGVVLQAKHSQIC